jgi:hypothetical protein
MPEQSPYYVAEIEGMEELYKIFKRFPAVADKHMRTAMKASLSQIEFEVKPLVPVFQGTLRNSIQSEIEGKGTRMVGRVGSTLKKEEYPAVMEFGRRAGAKMPPPSALYRWVKLVLKVPDKAVPGVAFVVARAIGKRGIKGKRFLEKGFKKAQPKIERFFNNGLTRMMTEITRGSK